MRTRSGRPHEISCGIRAIGRELVQFCIGLKNVPGAMGQVASELARYGVNILSGHMTAHPGEELGYVAFFADITDATIGLEELAAALKQLDVVVELEIREAEVPGLIVDAAHFPLLFLGQEVVIIDLRMIGHMFSRLDEVFGTGASVILYEMGVRAGKVIVEEVVECGIREEDVLKVLAALGVARGWGITEILSWDPRAVRLVLRVWENFECKPLAGRKRKPHSHFMRGVIAGIVSKLTGQPVKVREVKCLAKGDPYCEFVAEKVQPV